MKKMMRLFFTFIFLLPEFFLCSQELGALPYERFVSLGNCCATRTQINEHLKKRFDHDPYTFGGGQLFDWMVIHDNERLIDALDNDLSDIFEKSDLLLTDSWMINYPCVKNVKYNMTWNHLFTRAPDASIVPTILEVEYEIRKEKIDYLTEKFRNLSHYRTLYILAYPFITGKELGTTEPTEEILIRLRDALIRFRGNDNFDLLYCPLRKKFHENEHIMIRQIINPVNGFYYEGDYECWDKMLAQFPYIIESESAVLNDDVHIL